MKLKQDQPSGHLRGWVLAGGASSRMGRDKSKLPLNGHSLLELALDKVNSVCGNATMLCGSADPGQFGKAGAVADLRASCGPLGGIEAALHHTDAEWNFFLAVDTPLLPGSLLGAWAKDVLSANDSGTHNVGAALLSDRERIHALPLILRREILPRITASLDAGEYRLLQQVRLSVEACGFTTSVTDADTLATALGIPQAIDRFAWFHNANTPDDFEAIRQIMIRQASS